MGNARNVGGVRQRAGRRRPSFSHYITAAEAGKIAQRQKVKDEARGVFRRWNGRRLAHDPKPPQLP